MSSNVAFGVGYYRDESDSDAFTNVQAITQKVGLFQNAINSFTAEGGGDVPEGVLNALYHVATKKAIGWRPDSRHIIVYFGDAAEHEPTCIGGLKLTRKNVIAALKKAKITAVAVSFTRGSYLGLNGLTTSFACSDVKGVTAGNQASDITAATGGTVVEAEEQIKLIDA